MAGSLIGACVRKVRYHEERRALAFARKADVLYGEKHYSYYCELCRGWHLTTEVPLAQRLGSQAPVPANAPKSAAEKTAAVRAKWERQQKRRAERASQAAVPRDARAR